MTRTMTAQTLSQLTSSPRLPLIAALAVRFAGVVTEWDKRHRTRHALSSLDDQMLNDIGITYEQARREAARYFWQL